MPGFSIDKIRETEIFKNQTQIADWLFYCCSNVPCCTHFVGMICLFLAIQRKQKVWEHCLSFKEKKPYTHSYRAQSLNQTRNCTEIANYCNHYSFWLSMNFILNHSKKEQCKHNKQKTFPQLRLELIVYVQIHVLGYTVFEYIAAIKAKKNILWM